MHPQNQDYPNPQLMDKTSLPPHETGLLLRDFVVDTALPLVELSGSEETKGKERHDGSVPVTCFRECQRPEERSDTRESLGLEGDRDLQRGVDVERSHLHLDEQSSSRSTATRTQTMPSGYTFTYANSSPQPSSPSQTRSPSSSLQRGASTRIPRYARRSRDYFVPTLTYSAPATSNPTIPRSTTLPACTTVCDQSYVAAPVPSPNVDPITSPTPPTASTTTTNTPAIPISSSSSSGSSSCGSSESGSPTLSATSIANHTPILTLTATSISSPATHAIDSITVSSNSPVLTTSTSMNATAPSSSVAVKPPTTGKPGKTGPNAKVKASGSSSVVGHGFPLHATTYTTTSTSPPVPSKAGVPKVNPKSKSTTSLPLSGTLSNPIGSTSTSSLTMTLHRPTSPLANSFTPDDASVSSRGSIDDNERGQKGYFGFARTRSKSTGGSRKSVVEDDEKASSSGHGSIGHGNGLSAHPSTVPSLKTHQFATSHPPFQSLSSALAAVSKAPVVSATPPQPLTSKVSSRASSRSSSTTTLPLPSPSTLTPPLPTKSTSHSQSTTYKGYAGGSIYGEGYGGTNSFPRMPIFMQKPTVEGVDEQDKQEGSDEIKHEAGRDHQRARSEPGHGAPAASMSHRTSPSVSSSQYHSASASPHPSSSPFRGSSTTPSPSHSPAPSTTPSNSHSRTLSSPSPTQPANLSSQSYSHSYTNSHTSFSSSPPPLPKPLHIRTQVQRPESASSCEIHGSSPTSPSSRRPLPMPPSASSSSTPAISPSDWPLKQQSLLTQVAPVLGREASQSSDYYTPIWSPQDHPPSQTLTPSMAPNENRSGGGIGYQEGRTESSLPPLNREISQSTGYYTPTWSPYSPSTASSSAGVELTSTRTPSYSHSRTWSQPQNQTFGIRNDVETTTSYGSYGAGPSGFGTFNSDQYFPPTLQHRQRQQTSGSVHVGGHLRTWSQPHPFSFSHPNPQPYIGHTRGYSEPRTKESFKRPKSDDDEEGDHSRTDGGRLSLGISLWDDDDEESESGSGKSFHTASSDESESREEQGSDEGDDEVERGAPNDDNEDEEKTAKRDMFEEEQLTYSYTHLIPGMSDISNPFCPPSPISDPTPSSTSSHHAPKTPPRTTQTLPPHVQPKTPPRHSHSTSSSPPRPNSSSHAPTHKSYGWADKFPLPPSTTPTSPLIGVGGSSSLSPRSRYAPLPSPGSPNRTSVTKTTPTPTKITFGVGQNSPAGMITSMGSDSSKLLALTTRNAIARSNESSTFEQAVASSSNASTEANTSGSVQKLAVDVNSSTASDPTATRMGARTSTKQLDDQAQDVEVVNQPIMVPILAFPPKVAKPDSFPTTTLSPAPKAPLNPQPMMSNEGPPHSAQSTSSSPLSTLLSYPPGLTPPLSAQAVIPSFSVAVATSALTVVEPALSHPKTPGPASTSPSVSLVFHQPSHSHDKELSDSSTTNTSSNPASNPSTFGFSTANPYTHAQFPSTATSASPSRSGPASRNASFVLISGAKFVDEIKEEAAEKSKDKESASTTQLEKGQEMRSGAEEVAKEEDMEGYEPQWPMRYLTSAGAEHVDEMGVKTARGADEIEKPKDETPESEKKGVKVEQVKKKGRKWIWRRSGVDRDPAKDVKAELTQRLEGPAEQPLPEKRDEHAEVERTESVEGQQQNHEPVAAQVDPSTTEQKLVEPGFENVTAAVVETERLQPQSQRLSLISRMSRRISIRKDSQETKSQTRGGLDFEEANVSHGIQDTPKEKEIPKKQTKLRKKRRYSYAHVLPLSRRSSVQQNPQAYNKEEYDRIIAEEVESVSGTLEGYLLIRQSSSNSKHIENGMMVEQGQQSIHEMEKGQGVEIEDNQNEDEDRRRGRTASSSTSVSRPVSILPELPVRPLPQSQTVPHTPPLQHLSLDLSLDQRCDEIEDQDDDDDRRNSTMVDVEMDVDALHEAEDGDGDDDVDENDFSFVNPIQQFAEDIQKEPTAEPVQEGANEWEDVPFSDEGALFVKISPGAGSCDEVEPFVENYPWTTDDDDSTLDNQILIHQEETRRRIEEMLQSKGLDVVYEEDEEDEENGWVEEEPAEVQEVQALHERRTLKKRESYPHIRDKGKTKAKAAVAQVTDHRRDPDINGQASLGGLGEARHAGGYGDRGVVQEDDDEVVVVAQEVYEEEGDEEEEMEMDIFEDALEPIEEEPDLEQEAYGQDHLSGLIDNATFNAMPFDLERQHLSSDHYRQNHIGDQQQHDFSALDTYSKPSDHEGHLTSGDATDSTTPTMTLTPASSMMLLKNPLTTTTTTVSPATTIAAVTPVLSAQILKDPIPPLPAGAAYPMPGPASYALNISTSMNGDSTTGTTTPTPAPSTPASKLTPLRRVPKSRSGSSLRQMRVGGSRESLRDRMGTVGSKKSPKVSRERLRTSKGSNEGLRTPSGSREGLRETRRSDISASGKVSRKDEKKRKMLVKARSAKSSIVATSSSTLKGKDRESQIAESSTSRTQTKSLSFKMPVKKPSQASLRATRRPTSSNSKPKTFLGSLRTSLLRPIHLVFGTNRRRLSKELRTPNTLVQNRRFSEKYIPRFPSRLDGIRGVEKRVVKYE